MSHVLIRLRRSISSCFHSLQPLILKWTKPSHTSLLLGTVMDLARGKSELVAEHALLRQQLIMLRRQIKRPTYTKTDRLLNQCRNQECNYPFSEQMCQVASTGYTKRPLRISTAVLATLDIRSENCLFENNLSCLHCLKMKRFVI